MKIFRGGCSLLLVGNKETQGIVLNTFHFTNGNFMCSSLVITLGKPSDIIVNGVNFLVSL